MTKFGTEYHREYYKKRRAAVFLYLGNKCAGCSSTENLEVDHINKADKSFSVSTRLSVKNNKDELDKCQLLCNACHKEKTSKENSGFSHGTVYAWMKKKCQCVICLEAKTTWHNHRNAARRKQNVRAT